MTPAIRFTFLQTGETAVARLLADKAPRTCEAVSAALPACAVAHHASYSGSEGVMILPERLRVAPENATADVTSGDVGFTWFAAGSAYGVTSEFAEICWFYDNDARPSMHEGPVPVSVFAQFRDGSDAFYGRCRAMRRSGVTSLLVENVGGSSTPSWMPYHDARGEAPLVRSAAQWQSVQLLIGIDEHSGECRLLRGSDALGAPAIGPSLLPAGEAVLGGSLAVMADGCIVSVLAVGSARELMTVFSSDGGRAWTPPLHSGLRGTDPDLVGLRDGRLVLAYVDEVGPHVVISADGAASWRPVAMPEGIPHMAGGQTRLTRPVLLPLADGRIACGACSPDAAMPDWATVIGPNEED